jgi:serine/threonine protein kinase
MQLESHTVAIEGIRTTEGQKIILNSIEIEEFSADQTIEKHPKIQYQEYIQKVSPILSEKISERIKDLDIAPQMKTTLASIMKIYTESKTLGHEDQDINLLGVGQEGAVKTITAKGVNRCYKNNLGPNDIAKKTVQGEKTAEFKKEFKILEKIKKHNINNPDKRINTSPPIAFIKIVPMDSDGTPEPSLSMETMAMMTVMDTNGAQKTTPSRNAEQFVKEDIKDIDSFKKGYQGLLDQIKTMHKINIHHRDLHERNVMIQESIDEKGSVDYTFHIIDFGCATQKTFDHYIDERFSGNYTEYTPDEDMVGSRVFNKFLR